MSKLMHIALRPCFFALIGLGLLASSCSEGPSAFVDARREVFKTTKLTQKTTRTITLTNTNSESIQHVLAIGFGAGANKVGNFKIDKVDVDGVVQGMTDISIAPNANLHLTITYEPLDLKTTDADWGGWVTGNPVPRDAERIPANSNTSKNKSAIPAKAAVGSKAADGDAPAEEAKAFEPVPHRTYLLIEYDYPNEGYLQMELVGFAAPGPNGEVSVAGGGAGGGECTPGGNVACYTGGFAIDLPGLMQGGAQDLQLTSPVKFQMDGSSVKLEMNTFPNVLLVLKGNGPGEPLEGKPVASISIVISGATDAVGTGTFDGRDLELTGVGFRIRVVLGEITEKDITPGLAAAVDFNIKDLAMTTVEPFDNGFITLSVETKFSSAPSGNPLFDQFLGNQDVMLVMKGEIAVP